MVKIILASKSKVRKQILDDNNISTEVQNSNLDEDIVKESLIKEKASQEIENVLPHAVNINSRGHKTVNYNSLIPLLIEAVKELSARVKELEEPKEEIDG